CVPADDAVFLLPRRRWRLHRSTHAITLPGWVSGEAQPSLRWEYEASPPATWSFAGTGCAGSAGTPALAPQLNLPPVLGTTWTLGLTYGNANGLATLALGASNQAWIGGALPQNLAAFGAPGCSLHTSTDWLGGLALVSGTGAVSWTLPSSPALAGLPCFAQALVFEAGANPLGAILSNAFASAVGLY
ncbi:MAG: hypothetical protein WAT39_15295, partial [Planctomycetota bacterium]